MVVFRLVATSPTSGVIAVLLAAAQIAAGRLDVPVGGGEIHTSVHAGGMASLRMRASVALLRTASPDGNLYRNNLPDVDHATLVVADEAQSCFLGAGDRMSRNV